MGALILTALLSSTQGKSDKKSSANLTAWCAPAHVRLQNGPSPAQKNSHGSREQSVAGENQSRKTEHQPPQQLQAAVHGEAGWQAGPTGTCTVTFCGTILQTWTVTLLVTFTGTQTVYFSVCFR